MKKTFLSCVAVSALFYGTVMVQAAETPQASAEKETAAVSVAQAADEKTPKTEKIESAQATPKAAQASAKETPTSKTAQASAKETSASKTAQASVKETSASKTAQASAKETAAPKTAQASAKETAASKTAQASVKETPTSKTAQASAKETAAPQTAQASAKETSASKTAETSVKAASETPKEPPMSVVQDTFLQAELAEAFQKLIGQIAPEFKQALVIEQRKDDFIVTIPEMLISSRGGEKVLPEQRVVLERTENFAGFPQFKVKMDFIGKIQSFLDTFVPHVVFDADTYDQTMYWVPKLQLVSNSSLRAENLTVSFPEAATASMDVLVSDKLSKQVAQTDKMDTATAMDVTRLSLDTDTFQVNIPRVSSSGTVLHSTITGDPMLAYLTASHSSFEMKAPMVTLTSAFLPGAEISADISLTEMSTPTRIEFNTHLKEITVKNITHTLIPDTVRLNIVFDNLSQEDLIQIWSLQQQSEQIMAAGNPLPDVLVQKLNEQIQKVLDKTVVRIPSLAVSNKNAGIEAAAVMTSLISDPHIDMTLSITNFDYISPKPKDVDLKRCEELVAQMSSTPADTRLAAQYHAECEVTPGLLDDLRPYLKTAAHDTNEEGLPVDTFMISYQNGVWRMNNQVVQSVYLPNIEKAAETLREEDPSVSDQESAPLKEASLGSSSGEGSLDPASSLTTAQMRPQDSAMKDFVDPSTISLAEKKLRDDMPQNDNDA